MNDDLTAAPLTSPASVAAVAVGRRPPAGTATLTAASVRKNTGAADETRGCLFALSQPPLMLFLGVIGSLLLIAALHDLYPW